MIKGFGSEHFALPLCVSASCLSATREQTEMGMRKGAAQGHPDNRERYVESLFLFVYFTLTGEQNPHKMLSAAVYFMHY